MIGKTNIGASIISANAASIHVIAPTGSTIIFSKDGIIISGLYPSEGTVDQSDAALTHYYYYIEPKNFGTWTITATYKTYINNSTVNVNATLQYQVSVQYDLYIIKNGILQSGYTYSKNSDLNAYNGTSTGYFQLQRGTNGGASWYYIVFSPQVNFQATPYKTMYIDYQIVSTGYNGAHPTNLAGFGTNALNDNFSASVVTSNQKQTVARNTKTLNVSGLTSALNFKYRTCASSVEKTDVRFFNIWLSNG